MWGALFMADSIRMDLRDLGVEAWVLWQPDWEVIASIRTEGHHR
jgi:hypothetical protein